MLNPTGSEMPPARRSGSPGPFITAATMIIVAVLALGSRALYEGKTATIDVDMISGSAGLVQVFFDLTEPPLLQPLEAGVRKVYRFGGVTDDIHLIRLDPADSQSAEIGVYSIAVLVGDRVVARFDPPALAAWDHHGIELLADTGEALRLRSTTPHPSLWTSMEVRLGNSGLDGMLPRVDAAGFEVRLSIGSLLLGMLAGAFNRRGRMHILLAVLVLAIIVPLVPYLARFPVGGRSAQVAVSRATFLGLTTPHLAAIAALCVGLVAGTAAALWTQRRARAERDSSRTDPDATPTTWRADGPGLVGALLIVLSPDMATIAQHLRFGQFTPHWDVELSNYWSYAAHRGYKPFRDFWYPYGGLYLFHLPLPWGSAIQWGYDTLLYGTFFLATSTLSRRWRVGALLTSILLLSERLDMVPALSRYLLGVNLVLAYAAVPRERTGTWPSRVVFWIAFAQAWLFEQSQAIYASVPIAAILALDLAGARLRGSTTLQPARRCGLDFGVPLAFVGMHAAWLTATGQIAGFTEFYVRLADIGAYAAMPTSLESVWAKPFAMAAVVLAAPPVLVAIGFYERLVRWGDSRYGDVLLGLGLLHFVVLQKHLGRPMEGQMFFLWLVSVMIYFVCGPHRQASWDRLATGVVLGLMLATLLARPAAETIFRSFMDAPRRTVSNLKLLATRPAWLDAANDERFATARFNYFPDELRLVQELKRVSGDQRVSAFVLTDAPVVYILTAQKPVWMANLYNGSPIYEQQRIVEWLHSEPDLLVALRPDRLNWDGFQKATRLPIVFGEVALHYVPVATAGPYDIVRRRSKGEPPDLGYWRTRLGSELDLGHLPRFADDAATICHGSDCGDQLVAVLPPPAAGGHLSIPVAVAAEEFRIRFETIPGHRRYVVPLERVWFWYAARNSGMAPEVLSRRVDGAQVRVRQIPKESGRLF